MSKFEFCNGKKHRSRIEDKFGDLLKNKSIFVPNISDDYQFMDEKLIDILNNQVAQIVEIHKLS